MRGNKLLSLLGIAMLAVGVFIAIKVEGRGDTLVIFFVGFGGFLVSKTVVTEFFTTVWGAIRGNGRG